MASVEPMFEVIDGEPIPVMIGGPVDGVRFLNAAQAAARFPDGTEAQYIRRFKATFKFLDDMREEEPVLGADPAASATPAPSSPAGATGPLSLEQQARLSILRRVVYPHLSDDAWSYFLDVCAQRRLNPFSKQVSVETRYDHVTKREVVEIITSVHALNLIANRTGKLRGIEQTKWCGPDREFVEVWTDPSPPTAAKVGVLKEGFDKPIWAVGSMEFYAPLLTRPGANLEGLPDYWVRDRGVFMLGKCTLAMALRTAFPEELGGLYAFEELGGSQGPGGRGLGSGVRPPPPVPNPGVDIDGLRYEPDPNYDPRLQMA